MSSQQEKGTRSSVNRWKLLYQSGALRANNPLGFLFSEVQAPEWVVLHTTKRTFPRKANFNPPRMLSPACRPPLPPAPIGTPLQGQGCCSQKWPRGTDKRGEGRKSHAVLLKEPLEIISCGFKPHFHLVACCLGVSILGNHRAVEIVSQGDWKKNITLQVCC